MQQVLMDDSLKPQNPVEGVVCRGGGGEFSAEISVFSKSMGLMQSYKKGRLIHKVAGVV